jgi:hypothetical protein
MTAKIIVASFLFILGLLAIGVGMFLQFLILKHIQGTELMWFLYWTQVPLMFLISMCSEFVKGSLK